MNKAQIFRWGMLTGLFTGIIWDILDYFTNNFILGIIINVILYFSIVLAADYYIEKRNAKQN